MSRLSLPSDFLGNDANDAKFKKFLLQRDRFEKNLRDSNWGDDVDVDAALRHVELFFWNNLLAFHRKDNQYEFTTHGLALLCPDEMFDMSIDRSIIDSDDDDLKTVVCDANHSAPAPEPAPAPAPEPAPAPAPEPAPAPAADAVDYDALKADPAALSRYIATLVLDDQDTDTLRRLVHATDPPKKPKRKRPRKTCISMLRNFVKTHDEINRIIAKDDAKAAKKKKGAKKGAKKGQRFRSRIEALGWTIHETTRANGTVRYVYEQPGTGKRITSMKGVREAIAAATDACRAADAADAADANNTTADAADANTTATEATPEPIVAPKPEPEPEPEPDPEPEPEPERNYDSDDARVLDHSDAESDDSDDDAPMGSEEEFDGH